MANKNKGYRTQLEAYLREAQPAEITLAELDRIRERLAGVSEGYLRSLLRATGIPLAPLVEGVVQTDFNALNRTLTALASEYEMGERTPARRAVLRAKEHARFALRRSEGMAAQEREEMLLWMNVWLENPAVFAAWLDLRRKIVSY